MLTVFCTIVGFGFAVAFALLTENADASAANLIRTWIKLLPRKMRDAELNRVLADLENLDGPVTKIVFALDYVRAAFHYAVLARKQVLAAEATRFNKALIKESLNTRRRSAAMLFVSTRIGLVVGTGGLVVGIGTHAWTAWAVAICALAVIIVLEFRFLIRVWQRYRSDRANDGNG